MSPTNLKSEVSTASAPRADATNAAPFGRCFKTTGPFADPGNEEKELWRAGKLVPFYITYLLDAGGHVGPSVDAACCAEEPAVDHWELGLEYPSWEQTVALARLLNVRVRDLTHPDAMPRHHPDRPRQRNPKAIILSFEPDAVAATVRARSCSEADTPSNDHD